MVSVVFCWWVMCVALMETWIAWRSLHHMRLAIHHIAHCFWICGRWSCVWSKNCLKKDRTPLVFRVEMQKARRLERIVEKCPFKNRVNFFFFFKFFLHILPYLNFSTNIRIVEHEIFVFIASSVWNTFPFKYNQSIIYIFFLSEPSFVTDHIATPLFAEKKKNQIRSSYLLIYGSNSCDPNTRDR